MGKELPRMNFLQKDGADILDGKKNIEVKVDDNLAASFCKPGVRFEFVIDEITYQGETLRAERLGDADGFVRSYFQDADRIFPGLTGGEEAFRWELNNRLGAGKIRKNGLLVITFEA